jgi:hypothetical protein
MGNDADLSRAKSEGSSDGDKSKDGKESGPEVIEHIKSNLKMYLSKTPIIDTNNEIIL